MKKKSVAVRPTCAVALSVPNVNENEVAASHSPNATVPSIVGAAGMTATGTDGPVPASPGAANAHAATSATKRPQILRTALNHPPRTPPHAHLWGVSAA